MATPQNSIDHDIQLASFFVRSKPMIKTAGIIIAITLEAIFLVGLFWYWGSYYPARTKLNSQMVSWRGNIKNTDAIHTTRAAEALKVLGSQATQGSAAGLTDMMALVQNPNTQWIATVSYHFNANGTQIPALAPLTILPGETRVLGVFDYQGSLSTADFAIDRIDWIHIDRHEVSDSVAFMKEHYQFNVSKQTYDNAESVLTTDRITFDIKNESPYGYFEAGLDVVLSLNGSVIGVEQVTVAPIASGETKSVEIHSSPRGVKPDKIDVYPHVNVFDGGSYMNVGS